MKDEGSFIVKVLKEEFGEVESVRVAIVWFVVEERLVIRASFIVQLWVVFVDAPIFMVFWSYNLRRAEPTGTPESKLTLIS